MMSSKKGFIFRDIIESGMIPWDPVMIDVRMSGCPDTIMGHISLLRSKLFLYIIMNAGVREYRCSSSGVVPDAGVTSELSELYTTT